ncbi:MULTISPECIES: PAS domain-containing sensor histidine kinase [Winogradskyella]|uniref:sensor histidine kinase n=1 Tax=Winogradskyella TaxID=286104 RepID=UPI0015CBD644|nr:MULTISPECIES: PAS domain-containing sensor histidine kinase [Winogradskyella]QXP80311.1 PAS domain-containing protein [Winogradskyella sp. HaHa_3_26]
MNLDISINNLPALFFRTKNDKNWTAEYMSEACLELTGYTSADFIEKRIHLGHLIIEENRSSVWDVIQQALANQQTFYLEYHIKHKNGGLRFLSEHGQGIYDKNNNLIALERFVQDISEADKTEQQFIQNTTEKLSSYAEELENTVQERTNEFKYIVQKLTESNLNLEDQIQETRIAESKVLHSKFLLENMSRNFPKGFVIVFDLNFKILLVEGEEVVGLGFKGIKDVRIILNDILGLTEIEKEKIKLNIEKTLQGEHCSFEIEFNNRCYLVNTTPLMNLENKIEQILMVYNNITLQKDAELEVVNTLKKEQELSELKSRFISMASHEFRTPLSAILSSAILIEKLNAPGKEDKRLKHVSKIRSNVKNLVVILNDFLSLSKLQEGKVLAQPSSFDLIDFSKSVIEEMESVKKSGQTFHFKCEVPKVDVFLDHKLMRHILFNLLSNAIKYSEEEKTIVFKIKIENTQIFIAIIDEGIGIPKEEIEHMFQRFYRANNTTNIEGTGLGLNIVKQYTELMGGAIKLESKLNVGSTFNIQLPLKMI